MGSFYIETPHAGFGNGPVLSGHYDCHENMIVNCGTVSASFAFLVVALGVLIFGIYIAKQRQQSPGPSEEQEPEEVSLDQEGWETKVSDVANRPETEASDDERWEEKPDG
jgi:hypothetical protein